ncbi:hypothetical protein F5148DRAFT_178024 [Russula earlei]|uniref:Uncharacterized protein n=1 Tax=Russula earlei TaxID=71964 RepID=A0ACC0UJX2_9AGAM|nr:hypothetical protein F5148DRAFT_178024 [Russula earlei]
MRFSASHLSSSCQRQQGKELGVSTRTVGGARYAHPLPSPAGRTSGDRPFWANGVRRTFATRAFRRYERPSLMRGGNTNTGRDACSLGEICQGWPLWPMTARRCATVDPCPCVPRVRHCAMGTLLLSQGGDVKELCERCSQIARLERVISSDHQLFQTTVVLYRHDHKKVPCEVSGFRQRTNVHGIVPSATHPVPYRVPRIDNAPIHPTTYVWLYTAPRPVRLASPQ